MNIILVIDVVVAAMLVQYIVETSYYLICLDGKTIPDLKVKNDSYIKHVNFL
jgi:hypothetical protein